MSVADTPILDPAFDLFTKVQRENGAPPPDEVSFVGGFMTCFGIITGKVDIGLDQNAPLDRILDVLHKEIAKFGLRIVEQQAKQGHHPAVEAAIKSLTRKQ